MTDEKGNPINWEKELGQRLADYAKLVNLHLLTRGMCRELSVETTLIVKYVFGPKSDPRCEVDDIALAFFGYDMIQAICSLTKSAGFYFEGAAKPENTHLLSYWINPDRLRRGDNLIEIMHKNAAAGSLQLHALPNHNAAGCDLNVIANVYFNFLQGVSHNAPVYDASSAFARWTKSFGNVLLAKEKREMLSQEVVARYGELCEAMRGLSLFFTNYEHLLIKKREEKAAANTMLPYEKVVAPPGFEKTRTGDGPYDYEITRKSLSKSYRNARTNQKIPTEAELEGRNAQRRNEAISAYREEWEVLFSRDLFSSKISSAASNCEWVRETVKQALIDIAKEQVKIAPFSSDQLDVIQAALCASPTLTFQKLTVSEANGTAELIERDVVTIPAEAVHVRKLQMAVLAYCQRAAEFAKKLKSGSLREWNRVCQLLQTGIDRYGTPPCANKSDAVNIRNVIHDASAYLYTDLATANAREETRLLLAITNGIEKIEFLLDAKISEAKAHNYKSPLADIFAPCFGDFQDVLKDGFTDAVYRYGLLGDDRTEYSADVLADKFNELCRMVYGRDSNTTMLFEVKTDEFVRDIGYGNNLYPALIADGVPMSYLELWNVVYRHAEETGDDKNWNPNRRNPVPHDEVSKSAARKRGRKSDSSICKKWMKLVRISPIRGRFEISKDGRTITDLGNRRRKPYLELPDGSVMATITEFFENYLKGNKPFKPKTANWRSNFKDDWKRFKDEVLREEAPKNGKLGNTGLWSIYP